MKISLNIKYPLLGVLLHLIISSGFAQQTQFRGNIIDKNGLPVQGAMISVKGQPGEKALSDHDGNFSVMAAAGQLLEVEVANQVFKELVITGNDISVQLDEQDDLIHMGYGIKRKKGQTGSAVGKVSNDLLTKNTPVNPANSLFGKIPGLFVMENGGNSGNNNPDIFIRGMGTLGNAGALILVDGFERPLSSLSVYEIESVEILKDAAALAQFGLRGANGVIMVNTKRGSSTGRNIELSYEQGITSAFRLPGFLDSPGYAEAMNQASANDGLQPYYSSTELGLLQSGASPFLYPDVNWLNESLRDFGRMDNLNATFHGGTRGIRYFATINYQKDEGLLGPVNENEGYDTQLSLTKFNLRTNLDIDLTKSTQFSVNIGGYLQEANSPGSDIKNIMTALYSIPPSAFPVKTGNNIWGGGSVFPGNPVAQISATGYGIQFTRELFFDGRLKQNLDAIINGLTAGIALSYDNSATYREGKTKKYQYESLSPVKDPATGAITGSKGTLFGTDTGLEYYHNLGSEWVRTTLEGTLEYTKQWNTNELNASMIYQQDELIRKGQFNTFIHQILAFNSNFSRSQRYFADFTLSYSGTSILPKGQRFGVFPAVALAWNLSGEDWFGQPEIIDDLKLRVSWGLTGSDLIPQNINKTQMIGGTGYFFTTNNNAVSGFREGTLGTSDVTFETSSKYNLGIDAGILRVLRFNADLFYDRRSNILVESAGLNSTVIGIATGLSNSGIVDNKGVEIGLTFNKKAGDITWFANGQFSFARNKIIARGEEYRPYDYLKRTGKSYGQAFGLEATGFFKDQADIEASPRQTFSSVKPGDIKYKDQNNDKVIDEYDVRALGSNLIYPELYFSGTLGIDYKSFGFHALLQGIGNHTLYLNTPGIFWPLRGNTSITEFSRDSWTPQTASTATLPRLTTTQNANNFRPNSVWYISGSFLKLRSVEFTYDLPEKILPGLRMERMRLFAKGINLFSIDNVKMLDPEEIGITYPTQTSYNFGIRIDF